MDELLKELNRKKKFYEQRKQEAIEQKHYFNKRRYSKVLTKINKCIKIIER